MSDHRGSFIASIAAGFLGTATAILDDPGVHIAIAAVTGALSSVAASVITEGAKALISWFRRIARENNARKTGSAERSRREHGREEITERIRVGRADTSQTVPRGSAEEEQGSGGDRDSRNDRSNGTDGE